MKRLLKGAISTLLIGLMCVQMVGMSALAKEIPSMKLPVKVAQWGDVPSSPEEMEIVLTALDGECPMPEGTENGTYTLVVKSGTTSHFPEISFPKLGIYDYTIHQENGSYSRCDYDNTVYQMRIYVTNAENGDGLETTTILYIDDVNTKFAEVEFVNEYNERRTREPETTSPTTPTTPPAPTEPTPSGELPTDPIRDSVEEEFDPLGVLGAFDEFGNPVGILPATGTLWWVVPILALGGVVLMVIGRRRGHENEE